MLFFKADRITRTFNDKIYDNSFASVVFKKQLLIEKFITNWRLFQFLFEFQMFSISDHQKDGLVFP